MPISRTYLCDDCSGEFKRLHWERDEPIPECPFCASASTKSIPTGFAIKTNASRAGDFAYETMEAMGHTNMKDNLREGDTAYMAPAPIQTSEKEAMVREMQDAGMVTQEMAPEMAKQVEHFWQMGGGGQVADPPPSANDIAAPPVDSMAMLHEAGKKGVYGHDGANYAVYGRSNADGT